MKKLNKLTFLNKIDVDQSDILSKNEMKKIMGGISCTIKEGTTVISYGTCAMGTVEECKRICNQTYSHYGWTCDCK